MPEVLVVHGAGIHPVGRAFALAVAFGFANAAAAPAAWAQVARIAGIRGE